VFGDEIGFLPRILGVLLIVNCFAYLAASLTWLLAGLRECC
jgi:hypothetical protein